MISFCFQGLSVLANRTSNTSSIEQEKNREQFLDDYDQVAIDFKMPLCFSTVIH